MAEPLIIRALIPFHLGELIILKCHLDTVKDRYGLISFCFDQDNWDRYFDSDWKTYKTQWDQYLSDITKLFFSEPPYVITTDKKDHVLYHTCSQLIYDQHIPLMTPKLDHLLCQGIPLNLSEEYIVITTKARSIDMNVFNARSSQFINIINQLSQKYKIVILGERIVEKRKEYRFSEHHNRVFSIYEMIVNNVPKDRIHDLTVPSLGNTAYNLKSVQQDCTVMRDAKFVVTFGCGGNCVMSMASAKMTIGYREDNIAWNDYLFDNKEYPTISVSNNWEYFLTKIAKYC